MKNLRTRLAVIGSTVIVFTSAAFLIRERQKTQLTQFRYEQAIHLYASENPMARHLALQLLRDLPEPHQAIPLIGRRLNDTDPRNRLYATHCLEQMLGQVVALPAGAERTGDGATRMSNQASEEYVRRWQSWFSTRYPNA